MLNSAIISAINRVLRTYFERNKTKSTIPAKDLMPQFIAAGIFPNDEKAGLPIRKILRELDKTEQLGLIPYVLSQRKLKNTSWFFTSRPGTPMLTNPAHIKGAMPIRRSTRQKSDESYVIDLCDEIWAKKALRQHKFDFLLGDSNSSGVQRKLPVDAYYPSLNLVVEYREVQHTKPVSHFDKPHIKTISGVHRGEQRKIYDQRRREILPMHGIKLIEVSYDLFTCDTRGRIIRNRHSDLEALKQYIF